MGDASPSLGRRSRLAPDVRRGQILDAAAAAVLAQGYLPLPLEPLAQAAGVSKGLIYAYFPTQYDLANALLERRFEAMRSAGLGPTAATALRDAALAASLIYFEDVAAHGPLVHVILRDQFMAGRLAPHLAAMRNRIIAALARSARRQLRTTARETIAAINMILTIPEQAGRLAHTGEMSPERARQLCAQLTASSVESLAPRLD